MKKDKIHVLILGDHMFHLSGVAHCLRDIANSLISTGKFRIIQLGAAIKHDDMRPVKANDDLIIIPTEGFGEINQVNQVCEQNQIDIILFMSDPRFYNWLLVRDNEIRRNIPLVWYSVWDSKMLPVWNDWIWNSVDYTVAISRLTEDIVRTVSPETNVSFMPHCVNQEIFKPLSEEERKAFKNNHLPFAKDKFLIFWNNRNGRRKNGATLLYCFKKFLDKVGHDKAVLLMKTDPVDQVGFNLPALIELLDLEGKAFIISDKFNEVTLAAMYSASDCMINISNAEGSSIPMDESLCCGVPVIATWTGGMREKLCNNIHNPTEWYGIPVFPGTRAVIGSPDLPAIFEDQVNDDDVIKAMEQMYSLTNEERRKWGSFGREHEKKNMNWDLYNNFWPTLLSEVHEKNASWPNKLHKKWRFRDLKPGFSKYDSKKKMYDLDAAECMNKSHFDFDKVKNGLK